MSFTITNNSAAVITKVAASPNNEASFTINAGSLPLYSGDSISGTNTAITMNDERYAGSPGGQIYLFIQNGALQAELYFNGDIYSTTDCSSGWCVLPSPILTSGQTFSVVCVNETLPPPSPTPTGTAAVTPTPTNTSTQTPTPTQTPSAS